MHLVTRCPGGRSAGVLLTLFLGMAVGLPVHADQPAPQSPLAKEAYLTPAKEIADAVLYFINASNFVTGQVLAVDGGLSQR